MEFIHIVAFIYVAIVATVLFWTVALWAYKGDFYSNFINTMEELPTAVEATLMCFVISNVVMYIFPDVGRHLPNILGGTYTHG